MEPVAAFPWIALFTILMCGPAVWLALKSKASRWITLCVTFYTAMACVAALYLVPWSFYSYYLLAILLVIAAGGLIVGGIKSRSADWRRPGKLGLFAAIVLTLSGAYFAAMNVRALSAAQPPEGTINMQFPLEAGRYAVTQGGAAPPLQNPNGHAGNPSQLYAYDIVALNSGLHSQTQYLDWSELEFREMWDRVVLAPCSGTAIWVRDGLEDSPTSDDERPAGNVVGIECDGIIVNLAHLRNGSVLVSEGDQIEAGQPIGRIGSSGRTIDPHLHIHAERGPFKGDFSDNEAVPISFDGAFAFRNRIMTSSQPAE
ncbi:M23 family metallopeptidase [Aurantiacibacter sediminis]|uniref:M23 family metallopeptidase n=1 Tax=Aurantiacibacter sediminis TaxID=2793064 RepID=A0ABS0N4L0_9SPHN|nr:M23 family metallopeptidase [Aurantiacibacter sediminis]MBH5322361.1 M23 family metallopeptidase [Aurantiacibacter sediminis]